MEYIHHGHYIPTTPVVTYWHRIIVYSIKTSVMNYNNLLLLYTSINFKLVFFNFKCVFLFNCSYFPPILFIWPIQSAPDLLWWSDRKVSTLSTFLSVSNLFNVLCTHLWLKYQIDENVDIVCKLLVWPPFCLHIVHEHVYPSVRQFSYKTIKLQIAVKCSCFLLFAVSMPKSVMYLPMHRIGKVSKTNQMIYLEVQ